ncbi:MAG: alanine/glycine:cation symporter family protein [Bacillota bacterium]|nr:alanine/glycine:cation symporter family protein [Bacillota bacterium]
MAGILADPTALLERWANYIWSPPMLVLLLGTGLFLTLRLRFLPQRWLLPAVRMLILCGREGRRRPAVPWPRTPAPTPTPAAGQPVPRERPIERARRIASALAPVLHAQPGTVSALAACRAPERAEGDISSFQALSTALAATVGTGNIVGVATAISLGGPGAVLWMWVTAVLGSATKFSEAVLALAHRRRLPGGTFAGGPMYYIREAVPARLAWLGGAFALVTSFAAFGTGNMVQANAIAQGLLASFRIPLAATGIALAALTGVVILGGVRRIGRVAATVVPAMTLLYALAAFWAIWRGRALLPPAVASIFRGAFTGTAARGGFAGATVALTLRAGVARGLLSNEAGLGSSPIAHAAAVASEPVEEGMVAMLATYLDTLFIGTLTAMVILTSGVFGTGANGSALSASAFRTALPGAGDLVVTLGLVFFAFTTIIGWAYYGERSVEFLFGERATVPYRILWTLVVFVGASSQVRAVWAAADIMNGLMALPNLLGLLLLSGAVASAARAYEAGRVGRGGGGDGGGRTQGTPGRGEKDVTWLGEAHRIEEPGPGRRGDGPQATWGGRTEGRRRGARATRCRPAWSQIPGRISFRQRRSSFTAGRPASATAPRKGC